MTKLTLSMEKSVLEKAKQIAAANDTSVSAMFSQFVQSMAKHEDILRKIGPLTKKLSGIIDLKSDNEYQDVLSEALLEKYRFGK